MRDREERIRDERMDERHDESRQGMTTADLAATPARSTEPGRDPDPRDARAVRNDDGSVALFPPDELSHLRSQWTDIQAEFVDEPRRSVEEADGLVAATIQRLASSFADARSTLEGQWARGGDVSTEDLRVALRRYRSFFDRLLAV